MPDISERPPAQAADLKAICESAGLDLIFQFSPSFTDTQLQAMIELASGFVYCGLLTGANDASDLVSRIRRYTDLPIAVGPDITTPEQVAEVTRYADAAITGSALSEAIMDQPEDEIILAASDCVRALKAATAK